MPDPASNADGITIYPLAGALRQGVDFELAGRYEPAPGVAAAIDEHWHTLCAANPELFDGAVLLVDGAALRRGRFACFAGRYRNAAAAGALGLPIRSLGVQGIVVDRGPDGEECVLLGLRGSSTRVYAGQWENAPAGAVEPPRGDGPTVGRGHVHAALRKEAAEELGMDMPDAPCEWLCLLEDAGAASIDAVLRVDLGDVIDAGPRPGQRGQTGDGEYTGTEWAPTARLRDWPVQSRGAISRPTLALLRWLGW